MVRSARIDPQLRITHRLMLDNIIDAYDTFAHVAARTVHLFERRSEVDFADGFRAVHAGVFNDDGDRLPFLAAHLKPEQTKAGV